MGRGMEARSRLTTAIVKSTAPSSNCLYVENCLCVALSPPTAEIYFAGLLGGALTGLMIPCSKFFSLDMVQISSPMSQGFNL